MNNKSSVSKAFNKHFFEFLNDILNVYPDNKDIQYAITSFETIKRFNVTAIIKVWYTQVFQQYKEHIEQGNIDFFIDKDYSKDLDGVKKSDEILKMIDNIRNPIKSMDEKNKDFCVKYIQNLSKLSGLYNSL
tara:strand:+ start:1401 stop:1796 length:396 start_codon:yes stop_codon:yes gene_type:complete